ncbi:MAG: hypothetical protein R3324_11500 [Halobacteriales archaeon]|nr:hypothetical protein [Halobacteriales archaeon]
MLADGELPSSVPGSVVDLPRRWVRLSMRCAGGRCVRGVWHGVPIVDLLDAVDAPGSTTHLLVGARDGSRTCVPIAIALDAILALEECRKGRTDDVESTPRLVGNGLGAMRALKGIRSVETIKLHPGESAEAFDHLPGGG